MNYLLPNTKDHFAKVHPKESVPSLNPHKNAFKLSIFKYSLYSSAINHISLVSILPLSDIFQHKITIWPVVHSQLTQSELAWIINSENNAKISDGMKTSKPLKSKNKNKNLDV